MMKAAVGSRTAAYSLVRRSSVEVEGSLKEGSHEWMVESSVEVVVQSHSSFAWAIGRMLSPVISHDDDAEDTHAMIAPSG